MDVQLKFVSKDECRKMIDQIPGDGVYIMTYHGEIGMSDTGKFVKKKKGKKMVDRSSTIVLQQNSFMSRLNLHKTIFTDLNDYNIDENIKTILIPQ